LFNAVSIVQQTILVKKVDFRSQSIVTLSSAIISGAVGILCAYKGYGPWALVFQQLLNSILRSIFYLAIVRWIPKVTFSVSSFSYVFNFGSKLLLSTFIDVIYKNLYKIVIGKKYSDADLGYYTKAEEFAMFPSSNVANIISRVCLPIMSKIQDDNERLLNVYRSLIRYTSFLIFPLMIGLLAVSRPFIITFLKDAWEPAVLILRILCLDWMLDFISVLNLNLLLVKGRTDLVLKLQVIKKIIAVAILFATVPFGIEVMCWGKFLYAIIAVIINTYYTKQLIGLRLLSQMCDILPFLIVSIVMGVSSYIMTIQFNNSITSLFAGIVTGIVMYLIMSLVFFKKDINALFVIIRKRNE
jgi:O-antigen/teichoic acid export membrane protein